MRYLTLFVISISSLSPFFQKENLPSWTKQQLAEYESEYTFIDSSFLVADFTGDNHDDIALRVLRKADKKQGVILLLKNGSSTIIGAGKDFGAAGDDFSWVDEFSVFDKGFTFKTTFQENGDVLGEKEYELKNAAVSLRQSEGSGGLIYYNGQQFVWIHQGD